MKTTTLVLIVMLLSLLIPLQGAELKPAAIFSDHMVLQRQVEVPVWGMATPGSTVSIKFMNQTRSTTANEQGKWLIKLDKMEAVNEPQELIVTCDQNTLRFKDVLVGDVWLGAGQSNMEFGWTFSDEFKKQRALQENTPNKASDPNYYGHNVDEETMKVMRRAITNPLIRVSAKTRDHLTTPNTGWARVDENNLNTMPALAGCIAIYLQEEIKVPVGIIVRAVSSTHTARWITKEGWYADPVIKKQLEAAQAAGKSASLNGTSAKAGFGNLYEEYIEPVSPYALRGFLWDQGEQGIGFSAVDWTGAMHALVTSWRKAWGQGDLPWSATDHYPDELEPNLKELGLPHFMIAKTDGLSRALHPLNKWNYAQKHVENILPQVYGIMPSFKQPQGAVAPGKAKPAQEETVSNQADANISRADKLAKSAQDALQRASKLTSPVQKDAREKEIAKAAAATRELMSINPQWAIEGIDEKNPWAVIAGRKARADLWGGIGEFELARKEYHDALAKSGSQLDAKSYVQMLIGDLYKQEQNWAKAEEFYLAAQKTGLFGDRKVLVPRRLEELKKLKSESLSLKLAPIFGDHMVLQCQAKVPVWGSGVSGKSVTVTFNGQNKTAQVDTNGKWIVRLDEMEANNTPQEMTISIADEKIVFRDILIGEVWLGSGQSNMAGKVSAYTKGDPHLAQMAQQTLPTLRVFHGGKWIAAQPEMNPNFSALMFAFGLRLQAELKQPVGLMVAAVGGTPSGDWVTEEMLLANEPYQAAVQRQKAKMDEEKFNRSLRQYEQKLADWENTVAEAKKLGKKIDPASKPLAPLRPGESRNKLGQLYEKHIRPFVGYGIRGVLWDQGEQGTGIESIQNDIVTPALIKGWRKDWNQGEFPFLFVQKQSGGGCAWDANDPVTEKADKFAPLPVKPPHISDGIWKELHIRIGKAPNSAMITSTDLGGGIHPPNKSGYGSRAARVALSFVYKQPIAYQGPTYDSHTIEGETIRVRFQHVGKGLAAAHSNKLQGFMIAGEDKLFHWADAVIEGDSVILRSPQVPKPVSARYAWSEQFPWANLFNKDGLPALTFRTDNW